MMVGSANESLGVLLATGIYRPALPLPVVVLAVVLVCVLVLLSARRERRIVLMLPRIVGVFALGWLLLGYSRAQPSMEHEATPPKLAVLIDTSRSMAQEDVATDGGSGLVSRLDAVEQAFLNEEKLQALRRVAQVELYAFDEELRAMPAQPLEAEGSATTLYRAVAKTKADATLLLTDGHDTTLGQPLDSVGAGRLFAAPVGAARSAPDLSLQAWPESDRLFEDQATTVHASIQQDGFDGERVVVELLYEGQVIEQQRIEMGQRSKVVRFPVKPPLAPGLMTRTHHYTLRASLESGKESFVDNNAEDVFIQSTRGQIKVLLLEGEPYWETQALARLLMGHPRFDLTACYAFGPQRRTQVLGQLTDPTIDPQSALDAFDVVVLGRQVQRLVDAGFAERLSRFVFDGGAVVFARGRPVESAEDVSGSVGDLLAKGFEAISPVDWAGPILGEMRVRLGESARDAGPLAGLTEGEVLTRLPGMIAATRIEGRKSASVVLLEQQSGDGPAMVAMASMRAGSGMSLAVLTDGLWRWQLLPGVDASDVQAESMYGVLWVRALQWLAAGGEFLPGQDIALEPERLIGEPDQPIGLQIHTRYVEAEALELELTVTDPSGQAQRLVPTLHDTPGKYLASFTPQQPGVYTVELKTPGRSDLIEPGRPMTTRIAIRDRSPEMRDTSARPQLLEQWVASTSGRCLALGEIDPIVAYLQTLQALRAKEDTMRLANLTWPVFALIAGVFGFEWVLRRRIGLR